MSSLSSIAITMGDPAGVGPEIIVKALPAFEEPLRTGQLELILAGTGTLFADAAKRMGMKLDAAPLQAGEPRRPGVRLFEVPAAASVSVGAISAEAGRLAFASIKAAG